jgi:hypothetical protein
LFITVRQPKFFDIIPLDPLQFANVYAAAFRDSTEFELPVNILSDSNSSFKMPFTGSYVNFE